MRELAESGYLLHSSEVQAAGVGLVGDGVGDDGARELGDDVEIGRGTLTADAVGVVESGVAGPGAGWGLERGLLGQSLGLGVNGEDADEVGAEIGHDDVLTSRVEDGLMWVRRGLAVWDCTWAGHGEAEGLISIEAAT